MIWRKVQDLSLWQQGALNGLLLGLLLTAPFVVYCVLNPCKSGCEELPGGGSIMLVCYCDSLNWWLPIELCLQVTVASYFVQKTSAKRIQSTILIWQIIGFVTAIENYFYLAFQFIAENWRSCFLGWSSKGFCERSALFSEFWRLTQPNQANLFKLTVSLLFLLFFNLLFSLLLRRRNPVLP